MANLNSNFNSKKPGLLNVSTNDIPLSSGFSLNGSTVFVEDGNGVKSGLKLGVELVEAIEPTTKNGVCTVSFCDRTYASISEVKLMATALEVYRNEIIENLEDALTPISSSVNSLNTELTNNTSKLTTVNEFVTSFQEQNVLTRLSYLESNSLDRNGSSVLGILTFSEDASIDMNNRPIKNLPSPSFPSDPTNKSYVDGEIASVKSLISDPSSLISQLEQDIQTEIDSLATTTELNTLETTLSSAIGLINNQLPLLAETTYVDEQDTILENRIKELEEDVELKVGEKYVDDKIESVQAQITNILGQINTLIGLLSPQTLEQEN